jgi:DNA-binding MarR family transcriptional regulator
MIVAMDVVESAPWLSAVEQRAWRAFLAVQSQLTAQLGRELQEQSGLSNADFAVLVALSEHTDQRMRILELARAVQWEKSRLSHQLTRMEQRGLLERSNCSEDRRGAFVVLTPQGREAVESAAPKHVDAVRRYLFDEISADQVTALSEICQAVLDRLERGCAGREAECPPPDDGCHGAL